MLKNLNAYFYDRLILNAVATINDFVYMKSDITLFEKEEFTKNITNLYNILPLSERYFFCKELLTIYDYSMNLNFMNDFLNDLEPNDIITYSSTAYNSQYSKPLFLLLYEKNIPLFKQFMINFFNKKIDNFDITQTYIYTSREEKKEQNILASLIDKAVISQYQDIDNILNDVYPLNLKDIANLKISEKYDYILDFTKSRSLFRAKNLNHLHQREEFFNKIFNKKLNFIGKDYLLHYLNEFLNSTKNEKQQEEFLNKFNEYKQIYYPLFTDEEKIFMDKVLLFKYQSFSSSKIKNLLNNQELNKDNLTNILNNLFNQEMTNCSKILQINEDLIFNTFIDVQFIDSCCDNVSIPYKKMILEQFLLNKKTTLIHNKSSNTNNLQTKKEYKI